LMNSEHPLANGLVRICFHHRIAFIGATHLANFVKHAPDPRPTSPPFDHTRWM
jgi:hypothetical protein